ncbi:MAG: DUF971 domain-containing protein [Acidobacteriota bacterium]
MHEPTYLTAIERRPAQRALHLTWSDGFTGTLDYDRVRGYCPCAACQGHSVTKIVFKPPPRPVEPVEIAPVGNYAVHIVWSDRHATGIYRFDYLRALCLADDDPEGAIARNAAFNADA